MFRNFALLIYNFVSASKAIIPENHYLKHELIEIRGQSVILVSPIDSIVLILLFICMSVYVVGGMSDLLLAIERCISLKKWMDWAAGREAVGNSKSIKLLGSYLSKELKLSSCLSRTGAMDLYYGHYLFFLILNITGVVSEEFICYVEIAVLTGLYFSLASLSNIINLHTEEITAVETTHKLIITHLGSQRRSTTICGRSATRSEETQNAKHNPEMIDCFLNYGGITTGDMPLNDVTDNCANRYQNHSNKAVELSQNDTVVSDRKLPIGSPQSEDNCDTELDIFIGAISRIDTYDALALLLDSQSLSNPSKNCNRRAENSYPMDKSDGDIGLRNFSSQEGLFALSMLHAKLRQCWRTIQSLSKLSDFDLNTALSRMRTARLRKEDELQTQLNHQRIVVFLNFIAAVGYSVHPTVYLAINVFSPPQWIPPQGAITWITWIRTWPTWGYFIGDVAWTVESAMACWQDVYEILRDYYLGNEKSISLLAKADNGVGEKGESALSSAKQKTD